MYHSFIKVDQGHHVPYIYLFGVIYSKACVNKHSWHRRPAKTLDANLFWLWPEHHRCCRDHLRSCVRDGGGHTLNAYSDLNVHFYDSPEHFMKVSM